MTRTPLTLPLALALLAGCAAGDAGDGDAPLAARAAATTAASERLQVTHGDTAHGGAGATRVEVAWDETRNEPIVVEDAGGDDRLVVRDVAGGAFAWHALRDGDDLVLRRASEAGFYPYAPTWDGRIVLRDHYAGAARRFEQVELFGEPVAVAWLETLARRSFYFSEGRDVSEGTGAAEVFWACYDEDRLAGRGGDDLYKVCGTSETVTIVDTGGEDELVLPYRVDSSTLWDVPTDWADGAPRLYVWRRGDDLWLEPAVRVVDFFRAPRHQLERLTFADGTWLSRAELVARAEQMVVGTPAGETLRGPAGGSIFDGLGGDDTLIGGGGDDIYRVRVEDQPVVAIRDAGGRDTVVLGRAWPPLALAGARRGDDLVLAAAGPGADLALVLERWFRGDSQVETVVVPGHATPAQPVVDLAAGAPEAVLGGRGDDTLRGGAASELVLGLAGDDVLVGRGGDDTLRGGGGGDLYSFHRAFGHDVVVEDPRDGRGVDTLELTYWYADEIALGWLGDDLRLAAPDGSSITVRGYLAGADRPIERVVFGDDEAWAREDLDAAIVAAYRDALLAEISIGVGCRRDEGVGPLARRVGCHVGYTPSEMKDRPATVAIAWRALGTPASVTFDGQPLAADDVVTVPFRERGSNHQLVVTRADGFSVTYVIDVGWYWVAP